MRWRTVTCGLLFLFAALAFVPSAAQAPAATTGGAIALAPGVSYQNIRSAGPAGEPWSIHVLRVRRNDGGLRVVAVGGATADGRMARALPSVLGRNAAGPGEEALAVVNGDYDLAAPYLGISDGLSVTSGRLWTTGKDYWPGLALVGSKRDPVIANPETRIELRAGRRRWTVGALNKPLGSGHGVHPRAFTPEYGPTLKGRTRFRAVVIGGLSAALPLRVNRAVSGVITEVVADAAELSIPAGSMVIAERKEDTALAAAVSAGELKAGSKVKIDFRVRVGGKSDVREAIGGFPVLVRDGRRSIEGKPSGYISQRHPRTAVCYNARELIFAVVDGRQPRLSYGMTLEELADLMVSLGCTVAMNTDGGGSSVMAVALLPEVRDASSSSGVAAAGSMNSSGVGRQTSNLRIVSSPSDGIERGRGNAWVILRRK